MTEKYLSLQSAIFNISSKDCEDISQKGSKQRSKLNAKASKPPEYERLLSKLRKIESDILFDREDALSKWAAIRNRLEEESAERRKFNLDDNNMKSGPLVESSPSLVTSIDVDSQKNDDSDDQLEELFSGFPELSIKPDTDNIKNIIRSEENRVLRLRDFGRWTGVNPRRTLEEACRSR